MNATTRAISRGTDLRQRGALDSTRVSLPLPIYFDISRERSLSLKGPAKLNQQISKYLSNSFVALSALVIAACGGGGGGGGQSPPPPPPPTNDTTFGTLAINANNADVIAVGLSLAEGTLAFTQTAISAVIIYAGDGLPTRSCGNTGTLSIVHQDNDSSFDISSGDVINITFTDCYDRIVDGIANGVIEISVSAFSLDAASASLAGDIDTSGAFTLTDRFDPSIVAAVLADYAFDFVLQAPEVLTVTATGAQLIAIEIAGITEAVSDFTITKSATRLAPGSAAANVNTQTTIDIFYDSELYGGTFTCESPGINFTGGGDLPDAAQVLCRGLNRSAVRVTNQNLAAVDPEGDGTYTDLGVLDWNAVLDGFMKTDSGLVLDDVRGDINLGRLAIQNNDVSYDSARDRLLVATSSTDATFPNALLSVSLGTNAVTPLVNFANEPNLARIAEDGNVIYVSFTDSAEIWPYDADTLQPQAVLVVQSDEVFSTEYGVIDLEVSPVDPDQIAVAFQFLGTGSTDTILFDGGSQLPNSYRDSVLSGSPTSYDSIEFSADGSRLFAGSTRSTAASVFDLDADGVASSTRLADAFGAGVERYGDWLLHGSRVYDGATLVKIGTYQSSFWAGAIDRPNNLALILSQGDLTAFQRDTFVPLATYDLGLDDPNLIRSIVPAGNFAVLVEDVTLHVLTIADISTLNTDECDVVSLTTNESESYTNYACPIDDAVYDAVRDKIYAATSSFLGVNGNSIAVIDRASGLVDAYVHIGSEPRHIAMSADGNRLHAIFAGADTIATLDLNTLSVSRVQQIDLTTPSSDPNALEPRHAIRIRASSIENDTFVVSLGVPTSSPFERLTAFRDGVRLADDVLLADLQDSSSNFGPFVIFDDVGQPFSLNQGSPSNVQTLSLGPTGLSAGAFFDVGNVLIGAAKPDVVQIEVFTAMGGLINLTNQTNEARYDPKAPSFNDAGGGFAVNADVASNDVYIFVGGGAGYGIGRYNYTTGALIAEQLIDFFPGSFFEEKMFNVGADQLGIVPNPTTGLVVIDKSAIQ